MKEGRASLTALAVALGRGLGTAASVRDALAPALLPAPFGTALSLLPRTGPAELGLRALGRVASLGMVDHVTLRMQAIDAAAREFVERGGTQLVVLGAGLDGRAFRLPWLAEVDVFEVDHPATQRAKRARIEGTPATCRSLTLVDVDFERQSVGTRLAEVGHETERPTLWIWEGVTPYLESAAIDGTLSSVGERSADGSRLAMTYAVASDVPMATASRRVFSVIGEPLRTMMPPGEAAQRVRAVGLTVHSDSGSADWASHHTGSATVARLFRSERLLVADR